MLGKYGFVTKMGLKLPLFTTDNDIVCDSQPMDITILKHIFVKVQAYNLKLGCSTLYDIFSITIYTPLKSHLCHPSYILVFSFMQNLSYDFGYNCLIYV